MTPRLWRDSSPRRRSGLRGACGERLLDHVERAGEAGLQWTQHREVMVAVDGLEAGIEAGRLECPHEVLWLVEADHRVLAFVDHAYDQVRVGDELRPLDPVHGIPLQPGIGGIVA